MAPLRLEIVVQPRSIPSPSTSTPQEKSIKWLEICYGDPTIQDLSEILEERFFQRNHVPLNIKILKFLDDLELYPEYKVRDIFSDIIDSQASGRGCSTVKVYRNPPSSAELADPTRLESLPPTSLARPKKRPLPPLFSENVLTEYPERSNHALPLHDPSLAQIGRDKRQKVEAFGTRDYIHPDRPLGSLEFHNVHYAQRRAPSPRAPFNRHADGSRKRKRESVDLQNLDELTEIPQASDPYGTPISSETAPHATDKPRQMMVDIPRETEVISIPDSPVNGQNTFDHRAPTVSGAHEPAKHSSPELPSTDPSLSRSREPSSHILPPKIIPPPPNQQHEIQQNASMGAPLQPQQASEGRLNVSQESAIGPSHQEPTIIGVKKTPSPKLGDKATQLGRLRRPKSLKPPPGSGRSLKVINGVKQKTPSLFDPIETSEGSSYEHEQLRSAERLKAATESHQTPKSTHTQAEPDLLRATTHSHTPPEAFADTVPPKSYQEPTTTLQRKVHSATTALGNGNAAYASACGTELETHPKQVAGQQANEKERTDQSSKITAGAVSNQTVPTEQLSEGIYTAVQSSSQRSECLPVPADSSQHVGHEKQDTEAKQKAQAEFDRIAAIRGDRTSSPRRRTSEPARAEENITGGQNACKEFEHPSFQTLNNVNQPDLASMTLEERRQWNLKYVMPVHLAKLREYNDQALGVKKQEQAAQAEARRREKQARAQEAKEARQAKMAAKKRAAEEQRAGQKQAKAEAGKAATEGRHPAEDQSQATEHRTEGLKARVGQRRQTQQAEAEKSKPTDFLQPTRMKTNAHAQTKEPSAKQVAKGVAEKAKQAAEAGPSSLVPGQAMSGNDANQVIESAPEQGVCNSNYQTWLLNRSPKAIHSAERQLQLANEWLKQTKRKSMVVQVPRVTAKATSSAPAPNKQQAQQNSQRPAKQVQKQRNEDTMGAQRLVSTTGPFMDDDALMAAGLTARLPVTSAPRQGLTSGLGTTDKVTHTTNAETKRVVPSKPQLHGILKAAESKSSSPAVDKSRAVRVRSMTPAIPSSSNSSIRGYAVSAEARRAATAAPEALKTPVRNAFRAARSVSFADDALPSSQPPDVNTNSTTQSSGARKGMLYRALEESNAKKADEASERAKATSARTTADLNKVTKPQTKAKQTKMTQHISHDTKQKGKAVDRLPARQHLLEEPLSYASLSEASTYFSDESDGHRMGKAGPSSRKRAKPILKASTVGPTLSDKRCTVPPRQVALSTSRPARNPVSRVRRRARSTHLVPSNISISISSSSSSSYSDSEVEKVFGQTDDVALLPLRNPSQQSLGASSRAESQRSATVTKTSSQAPEPSSTLKQPTNDFKASQRSEEWRLSQEADRQLQREHMEALRQERLTEAPPTKQNGTPVSSQRTPVQRPLRQIEQKTGKSGGKPTVSAGFDTSSLSKLRKAQTASQAASQPAVGSKKTVPRRDQVQAPLTVELANGIDSGSDSSSSNTDEVDPGQLVRKISDPPKKRNPFSKVFAELWPRK
ncbi:MAG: hypothetical protein LQ344_005490 [Seirophora lacunosa]|nr:MAG: hypothetical protein LQ344_005490 [Seirophora lacunosa]